MSEEEAEVGILLHYRAFRRGDAELVTRDYEQLTGEQVPAGRAVRQRGHRQRLAVPVE